MSADEIDILVTDALLEARFARVFAESCVEVRYPGSAAGPMTADLITEHMPVTRPLADASAELARGPRESIRAPSSGPLPNEAHGVPDHVR